MASPSRKEIHLALRAVLLASIGLPATRVFENVAPTVNPPPPGTPYIVESNVPATRNLLTATRSNGIIIGDGIYQVQYFGVSGTGIGGIDDGVDAIIAAYPPGLTIPLSNGVVLRIQNRPAPSAGGLTELTNGFAFVTSSIPWWLLYQNVA